MRRLGAVGALLVVLALSGAGASAAHADDAAGGHDVIVVVPPYVDPPAGDAVITNAQLRWGLNAEAGAGAFAPNTCNFLSAGVAGSTGSSRVWTAADGLYRAHEGSVRIEKPNADGAWQLADFDTRCLDPQGRALRPASNASVSGNQVVIDAGAGSIDDGGVRIQWRGSFTVAFYSGMTYWSVTDPLLTVDASGAGRLVATARGYGADMDDTSTWREVPPRSIVLAEVRGVDTSGGSGFSVVPEYLGVSVEVSGTPQSRDRGDWGSFPQPFVDFQQLTGQASYWYSSGGAADVRKPATALYVSYDAAAPIAVPPTAVGSSSPGGAAAGPADPVRSGRTVGAAATVPADPVAGIAPIAAQAPVTTLPAAAALLPDVVTALSPLVAPLLGTAAALGLSIIAVLSMMHALPWQRRTAV